MYYMLYIDQGMNRNLLFYAKCNEDPNRKESEIVWTEKLSEAYVLDDRDAIFKLYKPAERPTIKTPLPHSPVSRRPGVICWIKTAI